MRPFYRPPRTAPVISPHTPRWVRKATSDLKTVFTSTLYQVQYIEVKTVFDAPVLSATPDSSGNFTSYSTLGSKGYIRSENRFHFDALPGAVHRSENGFRCARSIGHPGQLR